jgi:hypothetical protein
MMKLQLDNLHRRDTEFAEFGLFVDKKSFLGVLCVSVVKSFPYPTYLNPSTIRVVTTRRKGMIAASSPTSKPAAQPITTVSGLI